MRPAGITRRIKHTLLFTLDTLMSDYIRISKTVALALAREAANLFHAGTGVAVEPLDGLQHEEHGFIDEITPNDTGSDIRYWANMLLHFVRTVHGIVHNELLTDDMLEDG